MKKIFLILSLLYSFSFAYQEGDCYPDFSYIVSSVETGTNTYQKYASTYPLYSVNETTEYISIVQRTIIKDYGYSPTNRYDYTYTLIMLDKTQSCTPSPTCLDDEELDSTTNTCIKKCNVLENSYQDGNGGCIDCSSYTSVSDIGTCFCQGYVQDGTGALTDISNISTIQTINGSQYETTNITCNGVLSMDISRKITPDTQINDPCLTRDGWNPPAGYIYKGTVDTVLQCSQFVNGDGKYINSQTEMANSDCPTDTALYCYLQPALDNNDTGITVDVNATLPNGEIPTDVNQKMDLNTSILTPTANDSVAKSNALLGAISGDLKDYFIWKKSNDSTFQKTLTDNGRELLKLLGNMNGTDTNINLNVKGVTTAVNTVNDSVKAQTDSLGEKLDSINKALGDLNNTSQNVDLNETNDLLRKILDDNLSDSNATGYSSDLNVSNIDSSFVDGFITNFSDAYNNMNRDLNSAISSATTLKDLLISEKDNAFNLNLPHATVTTCPYTVIFDIGVQQFSYDIDICKAVNPIYPVFYFVFSVFFSVLIIVFGFNSLMRLD